MDRQARYRSLLPREQFTTLSALDCPTLARLLRTRPVDVVLFDLQKPAMSAGEWLNLISQDAELRCVPIVWVGRDIPQEIYQRVCQTAHSELVPPQPNAEMLVGILHQQQQVAAQLRREYAARTNEPESLSWEPEEDIINDALSIFEQEADSQSSRPRKKYEEEWKVDEVSVGATDPPDDELRGLDVMPQGMQDEPEASLGEESSLDLDSEEFGTGKYGVIIDKPHEITSGVVNEKLLSVTTDSGERRQLAAVIEQITDEVVATLTGRLVEALVGKIDRAMIKEIVDKRLRETLTPHQS